ncbi:hypothetical protein ACJOV8_006410 [Formosa sp. 3Alg 14/1]|uniref:hypothetical protein n=1 Tax=Formosa sp. 3Alg 14/1 TaxID=3382190 RepID=UPI0039BDF6E5
MKKTLVLLLCLSLFVSCKNESKTTTETISQSESKNAQVLKGEFVYFADAAILQTKEDVYGIIINDKMHELDNQAKAYKKESTDMVPVEIKGIVKPKTEGEEGWPFQIEITEIVKVSPPLAQDATTIKIKNTNN